MKKYNKEKVFTNLFHNSERTRVINYNKVKRERDL